jgi:intracellular septation protein
MKLLFDFLPILIFFIAYKFFGIYIATAAAIIISVLQVGIHWIRHRNVSSLQIISLVLIVLLGGSTLIFHNEVFIKWKPTALYWALCIFFLASHFWGSKPCIQRLMESSISLPRQIWLTLNSAWAIFFGFMGILNLYVAYHFNTNTWVNFKLFGMLGLTLLFAIVQAIYLSRYIESSEKS